MTPDALMLFAAGKGTRMAPLTDRTPKPMIPVAGRPLIDHALALARDGGARRIVVNIHHLGQQIADHLAGQPDIAISDESDALLETGGGLKRARALLPPGPVLTLNPDCVWTGANPVAALRAAWDGARMDALLMLVPLARAGARLGGGDFALSAEGQLARNGDLVFGGASVITQHRLDEIDETAFSLNRVWDRILADGRAFGIIHPGGWCDVGRPDAIPLAEAMLAGTG